MSLFQELRLGKCCEITSSKRIFESEYQDTGVPFFRSKEIIENENLKSHSELIYISEERYNEIKIKYGVPSEGDLLLTSVGTLGIPYIVKKDDLFYFKDGNLTWLKSFNDNLCSMYLYYWLKSSFGRQSLVLKSIGSSQGAITIDILKKYKCIAPELAKQQRIAEILSSYDNLIVNNKRRIKLLEQMAEELYKEWFVRFRFPGHENAEFEDGIPKGWEYKTVESLTKLLRRGISPDYDDNGTLTVISQKCIREKIMNIAESRQQSKHFNEEINLKDGDTVICSTGTGTLGRVGQVYGNYPNTTFDSHVTLARAKDGIGKHFLFYALSNIQIWLMNMGIGSTNQQELYVKTISRAKILVPDDIELIQQFENRIETMHKMIISLTKRSKSLIKQRDLLLPRLMSGKLEV